MSNHSTERPNGFLTTEVFKSFFALSGDGDNLVWNPGKERIPDNWYRRPSNNPYDAARAAVSEKTILHPIHRVPKSNNILGRRCNSSTPLPKRRPCWWQHRDT